jgi:hypothetical protein
LRPSLSAGLPLSSNGSKRLSNTEESLNRLLIEKNESLLLLELASQVPAWVYNDFYENIKIDKTESGDGYAAG